VQTVKVKLTLVVRMSLCLLRRKMLLGNWVNVKEVPMQIKYSVLQALLQDHDIPCHDY